MAFGGENSESYYDEGVTAAMKGDLARAVHFFQKTIDMDPGYLSAHHQLGKVYYRMGDSERAVGLLEQVVKKKPRQLPPRLDYGFALLKADKIDAARNQFEQVIGVQSNNGRAHLGMAHVHFLQGDWSNAMLEGQVALSESPSNFSALYLVGRAAKVAGDLVQSTMALQKADALLDKTIEANPSGPEGYFLRGEICFVREQYSTALESYRAADDRAEEGKYYTAFGENFVLVDILAKEGLCYQRLNKVDRMRELGLRIEKIDPEHPIGKMLRETQEE